MEEAISKGIPLPPDIEPVATKTAELLLKFTK